MLGDRESVPQETSISEQVNGGGGVAVGNNNNGNNASFGAVRTLSKLGPGLVGSMNAASGVSATTATTSGASGMGSDIEAPAVSNRRQNTRSLTDLLRNVPPSMTLEARGSRCNNCCCSCACPGIDPLTHPWLYQFYLSFQSLGIIYGDLGTSPLYTFSSIFTSAPTRENVIGACSVMIWTFVVIVVMKYCIFILMADYHGEGGTFAMFTRLVLDFDAKPRDPKQRTLFHGFFGLLAIIGVSAILSDGVLTPAISVLGAVQGLTIAEPDLSQATVYGVSILVIFLLFLAQQFGTHRVSSLFSPIMVIWFIALIVLGINNIIQEPSILQAFNPAEAARFFATNGYEAFVSLGAIFLTVTGAEAMFADMGHFSRFAVRFSILSFVFPALIICYLGQGAALIMDPEIYPNVFYKGIPNAAVIPMLIIGTLAAIIASQAIISASFSLTTQAMRLHYFPSLTVHHTNVLESGQVYVPTVNWLYMIVIIIVVAAFQNATALGYAYGIAVSMVFFITTIFYSTIIHISFKRSLIFSILFFLIFGFIDVCFLAANLLKFVSGGWFTVTLALIVSLLMANWKWGHNQMVDKLARVSDETTIRLIESAKTLEGQQVPKLMICLSQNDIPDNVVIDNFTKILSTRTDCIVLLTIKTIDVPFVEFNTTITEIPTLRKVYRVCIQVGFAQVIPNIDVIQKHLMRVLELRAAFGELRIAYLIGTVQAKPDPESGIMRRLPIKMFSSILSATGGLESDLGLEEIDDALYVTTVIKI